MKTSEQDFKLFCNELHHWLTKFQLTKSWRIYYKHEKLDELLAETDVEYDGHVVMFSFTTDWHEKHEKLTPENIIDTAKHEAIHLLVSRLSWYAQTRYVTEDDIVVSEEKLVNTLMNFIK